MSGEKGTERVLCTTSEEYAREREKEYMIWETCHSGDLNVLLEKTNLLLQKGDEHAREELMQLYLNEEIVKPYIGIDNRIIELRTIMEIYSLEVKAGEEYTILGRKNIAKGWTLEKIRSYIRELKFLLWRMEFADEAETEAGEKLIGFIKENSVSPVYLIQTIRTTAMETFDVMVNIVEIMIDSSMYRHAYWILRAMQEEKPQEESIQIMVQELGKYVTE